VSIRYSIGESPYRWLILAGITFTAALFGTIFIFAFEWSHTVARVWLYAGLILTLVFLILAFLDWKERADAFLASTEPVRRDETGEETS